MHYANRLTNRFHVAVRQNVVRTKKVAHEVIVCYKMWTREHDKAKAVNFMFLFSL